MFILQWDCRKWVSNSSYQHVAKHGSLHHKLKRQYGCITMAF